MPLTAAWEWSAMAAIEEELHNALIARAADLLSAAATCLSVADMRMDTHPLSNSSNSPGDSRA
jgi:hypothetical protein